MKVNISSLTQKAIRSALSANQTGEWLREVAALSSTGVGHEVVMTALNEAKDELEDIA